MPEQLTAGDFLDNSSSNGIPGGYVYKIIRIYQGLISKVEVYPWGARSYDSAGTRSGDIVRVPMTTIVACKRITHEEALGILGLDPKEYTLL